MEYTCNLVLQEEFEKVYDEVHNDVRDNSNDPDWRPSRKNLLKRDPYLGNGEPDVLLVF